MRRVLIAALAALAPWGCGPAPARSASPAPESAATAAAARAGASAAASSVAPPKPGFVHVRACPESGPVVRSKGIELTNDVGLKWRLACAAKSALGEPLKNAEGYPSFHIVDPEVACMVLEINGSGAWLHRASVERAEALRAFLLAHEPVPDCSFTLLSDATLGPSTEGLRGGKGFSERKYPSGELETVDGALAYFRDHPNDVSANLLLTAQIAGPAAKRRKDLDKDLELALSFELAAFDRMEVGWLSDVGKQGYCDRVQKLLSLSWAPEKRKEIQPQLRFCKK